MSVTIDSTVAEKLQEVINIKDDLKTAIEGKGQSLDRVPFTEYADKITAIQGGDKEFIEFAEMIIKKDVSENTILTIPDTITYLGRSILSSWSDTSSTHKGLTEVNLNQVSVLDQAALASNAYLYKVDAPNVETIAYGVFQSCGSKNPNFVSIYFPKVTKLGGNAFNSTPIKLLEFDSPVHFDISSLNTMSSLQAVVLHSSEMSKLDGTFHVNSAVNKGSVTFYVPENLVNSYKDDSSNWCNYSDYIKSIDDYNNPDLPLQGRTN